ncbi:hypothetical protein MLD38_011734 [Melastoma candidum]|uniref:Uncharacterized protein n=1 Tax=Melastoma candidum TaxID=119954 RepID=A0ACB9R543_9MYRT|nr:hypothetical protein MLD38_011734 [Melastoma candidum]
MSWFARSIANSLNLADNDTVPSPDHNSVPESPRGVKEDLSELKDTLARQFWGVASLLAPPPPPSEKDPSLDRDEDAGVNGGEEDDIPVIEGIRSDFAEIGGRVRGGISRISNNKAVWEFTKMATSLLQLGGNGSGEMVEGEEVVGVSEEAVVFARNMAMHPETWLDFPIVDEDEDDDFELSNAQYEHALAIEKHAPGLAALRMEMCPGYMNEGCFWKIYFVLLHPRLTKEDAVLLSTPQIMELRAMLMQELHRRDAGKPKSDHSEGGNVVESGDSSHEELLTVSPASKSVSEIVQVSPSETANSSIATVTETEKHPLQTAEIHLSEKSADEEKRIDVDQVKYQHPYSGSSSRVVENKDEDDGDDWLKEDTPEISDVKGTTTINIENDEDVSFSDLEDDDGDIPTTYKKVTYGSDSSTKDSRDWVQLGGSSDDSAKDGNTSGRKVVNTKHAIDHDTDTKESSDWLELDDIDEE